METQSTQPFISSGAEKMLLLHLICKVELFLDLSSYQYAQLRSIVI